MGVHKMTDKYYRPEIHTVPDINIPEEDTVSSPLSKISDGKTIKVQLDSDVVIQKLSHDIYSSWKSGFRELYNNEARACRITARDYPDANPEIHITIDPTERQLTIEGKDSQGITVEVFDKSLKVLGVSSNFDSKEIGQMGMGFAGYTMIFEALKIESNPRGADSTWSALADGGIKFEILGNPIMKTYGTRLTGTYMDKITPDDMIEWIKVLSRFSKVNTFIHLTDDVNNYNSGMMKCDSYKNGHHYLMSARAELLEEDSHGSYRERDNKGYSNDNFISVIVERDDFDFYGYLCIYNTRYNSISSENLKDEKNLVTLIGTPVEADMGYDFDSLSGYMLNIKDERKYKPTTDRDRMKDESIEDIKGEINEEMRKVFSRFILKDTKDYLALPKRDKMVYDSHVWNNIGRIIDDETTSDIVRTMNTSYVVHPKKYYRKLIELLRENKPLVLLKGLRKEPISRLENALGDCNIMRFSNNRNNHDVETNARQMQVLREFGVIMGEEYIRLNRIKGSKRKLKNEFADVSVRLYSSWDAKGWGASNYRNKSSSHLISEVNANRHNRIIRVSKDMWKKCEGITSPFIWVRDRKGFDDEIKTLDALFDELDNIMFEVNSTEMLFKDIPKKNSTIIYCNIKDEDVDNIDYNHMQFKLHELDLNPVNDKYFISPSKDYELSEFFKNVTNITGLLDIYSRVNDCVHLTRDVDELVSRELKERLSIDGEQFGSYHNQVPLDKLIRLNRFRDVLPEQRELYELVKIAMLNADVGQSIDILKLGLTLGGLDDVDISTLRMNRSDD